MQRGTEHKKNAPTIILRKLPSALINKQNDPQAWEALQKLLYPDQSDYCMDNIDPNLICPITQRLMFDPVWVVNSEAIHECEAFVSSYPGVHVEEATDIRMEINELLTQNPSLKAFQYLPLTLIKQMNLACSTGNQEMLRPLAAIDQRLLTMPDLGSSSSPLYQAVVNGGVLDLLIELLDRYEKGLALASLLHRHPVTKQLPLERALHYRSSLVTLLKLMAWMGDSLASFKLTVPLSVREKPILNELLLTYVLRGDAVSAAQVITWGADINASLTRNMSLDIIFSVADRNILNILLKKIARNHDFVPYNEKKSRCSYDQYDPFQLCIEQDKIADSKTEIILSRDEQIDLLLKYKNIRTIVKTLTKRETNEGVPYLDDLKVLLTRQGEKTKPTSTFAYPTAFSVFARPCFYRPWEEPNHLTTEDATFQESILKTMGYES